MRAIVRFATSSMKEALLEANMRGVRLSNVYFDKAGGIGAITSPVTKECLDEWLMDKRATLFSAFTIETPTRESKVSWEGSQWNPPS